MCGGTGDLSNCSTVSGWSEVVKATAAVTLREIVPGVVGHQNTTKEQSHDPGAERIQWSEAASVGALQLQDLGQAVRPIGKEENKHELECLRWQCIKAMVGVCTLLTG